MYLVLLLRHQYDCVANVKASPTSKLDELTCMRTCIASVVSTPPALRCSVCNVPNMCLNQMIIINVSSAGVVFYLLINVHSTVITSAGFHQMFKLLLYILKSVVLYTVFQKKVHP